jgi:hypothetical protein
MSNVNENNDQDEKKPLSTHHPGALQVRRIQFETEAFGRGVFTTIDIPRGTLVENAHAIKIERGEYGEHLSKTCLEHYVYSAPNKSGDMFLALGLGSLFNHADPPNLDFRVFAAEQRVEYFAARAIKAGEELCIYYGIAAWWLVDKEKKKAELESDEQQKDDESEALPFGGEDF